MYNKNDNHIKFYKQNKMQKSYYTPLLTLPFINILTTNNNEEVLELMNKHYKLSTLVFNQYYFDFIRTLNSDRIICTPFNNSIQEIHFCHEGIVIKTQHHCVLCYKLIIDANVAVWTYGHYKGAENQIKDVLVNQVQYKCTFYALDINEKTIEGIPIMIMTCIQELDIIKN